ncbi:S9 family peptidase [Aliidiomarina sp. Khilg15.8]
MRWFGKALIALSLIVGTWSGGVVAEIATADFFRHAEFGDAAISPQGQYLAVSVPKKEDIEQGGRNLAIIDISDPAKMEITAAFSLANEESPINLRWVSDERLVFETMKQQGAVAIPSRTGRVYAINADGRLGRQIYGGYGLQFVGRWMSIIDYLPDEEDWILIQHWAHDRPKPIVARLNVMDGRSRRQVTSPLDRGSLLTDAEHRVRFAMGRNLDGVSEFAWREDEESEWNTLENTLGSNITPVAFSPDGDSIYISSRKTGNLGFYELELATGEVKALAEHPTVELAESESLMWNHDYTRPVAVNFMHGAPEWHSLDDDAKEIQWLRQLEGMFEGNHITFHNWTENGRFAMVSVRSDVAPPEFFVLDTEEVGLRFLAASKPWIDPQQMAPTQPVSFEARDGLEINGYMTLPTDYEEGSPVPFIVWVHGGPHGPRDSWYFYSRAQFFAHHGFGVLRLNYRGSGGYGVDFERAGYREWGAKMQNDITDGTLWAMEQGYADEERTCIGGASYGGFATLSGITKEPDLYACAFAFVGVYDLPLMKEEGNVPGFEAGRRYLDRVLGTDEEELVERSPTTHVAKIETPLFIAHGAEDKQAHVGQYHLLKERLDEADIPYSELLVEGEGHGFYKVDNNVLLFEQVIDFMNKHTE